MKVYVGCGLTKAPQGFRDFVQQFKLDIKENNGTPIEMLEFIGLEKGTAVDVWDHDLGNVRNCDVMLAIVDEPSIGLGIELCEAIHRRKPLLALYQEGTRVTRMLHGAEAKGLLTLVTYHGLASAVLLARTFITSHHR